jgi:hypothetical protein
MEDEEEEEEEEEADERRENEASLEENIIGISTGAQLGERMAR